MLDLENAGFEIKALFDANPRIIGLKIRDFEVLDSENLEDFVEENNIDIGILCIPKNGAQDVVDRLVNAGVKGIWNFAPIDLDVPKGCDSRKCKLNREFIYIIILNERK